MTAAHKQELSNENGEQRVNAYRDLRVALLGCGSVGAQVARLILENGDELAARIGARLTLDGIAVRTLDAERDVALPQELFTTDAERLVQGADIVIELMGGIEPARSLILLALSGGADVVTANKALIAAHGRELSDAADQVGAQLLYEASVAAAIPILRPLRESLAGDHITRVMGIVNGSTNYILDRMDRFGESAEDAMKLASDLGFLEADPTLDVEGFDAAQKATILASIAFHTEVPESAVYREGITGVTLDQITAARHAGFVIKLLAVAERLTASDGTDGVSVRVYPALDPARAPARRRLRGQERCLRRGRGGRRAHVLRRGSRRQRDRIRRARRPRLGRAPPRRRRPRHPRIHARRVPRAVRRRGHDGLPGHARSARRARRARSRRGDPRRARRLAASVEQNVSEAGRATLVIGTHTAREADLAATVDALRADDAVAEVTSVLRREGRA